MSETRSTPSKKCLVVFAHPLPDSFGAAVHRTTLDTLRKAGHEVRDIDLYAIGFNPVLSPEERQNYITHTQANIDGLQDHVDALRWADTLILVYPTWWYGPPAILKGWLDRTMLPTVAFKVGGHRFSAIKGCLDNIRCFVGVTTSGSPWWWLRVISDPGRSMFLKGMRPLFARGCKTRWLQLHSMNYATQTQRERFLARVQQTMSRL